MFWKRKSNPEKYDECLGEQQKFSILGIEEKELLAKQTRSSLKKIAEAEREIRETRKAYETDQAKLYLELLDVLDSIESLIQNFSSLDEPDPKLFKRLPKLLGGVQRRLLRSLEARDVLPIENEASKFDPSFCQVVAKEECSDVAPGTILHVLKRGFVYRDALLRPQEVIISENKDRA